MWSTGRSEVLASPPTFRSRSKSGRCAAPGGCGCASTRSAASLKLTCPRAPAAAPRWPGRSTSATGSRPSSRGPLPAEPFAPGAHHSARGTTTCGWCGRKDEPRTPRLARDELRCGGPEAGFDAADRDLPQAAGARHHVARGRRIRRAAGAAVRSVSIGDAGTRWGSCSSDGRIRLSWRLILAPPQVRRYVVAHEVAHLVHLNHGPAVQGPGGAAVRARPGARRKPMLRRIGPRLRRIGRRR